MDLFSEAEEILISSSSRGAPPLDRRAHVATFAFLLGAGRQAGNNETVLAVKDSDELARFFSKRYLNEMVPPPSISSSSLLIHGKSRKDFTVNNSKGSLQQLAVLNMYSKFYTTPDSAFYSPKRILENIMNGMEELIESRLKSTLLQLVQKSAERGVQRHMKLLFQLVSPSQSPLRITTVLTQFVSSETVNSDNNVIDTDNDQVELNLEFKAVIDCAIFEEVITVELHSPVSIAAKFDTSDNLLSAIDIKFDCEVLLNSMISNARLLVDTLIKKATALSIRVAKYHEQQSASALAVAQVLANKSPSVHSFGSFGNISLPSNCSNLFSSLASSSDRNSGGHRHTHNKQSNSRCLLRTTFQTKTTAAELQRVNEEFGLTRDAYCALTRDKKNEGVVRFNMPSSSEPARLERMPPVTTKSTESGTPNMYKGLFNWIQDDDKMFLSEDEIKEQNALNEEKERRAAEAPMPVRFFTAADEIGGLKKVSDALFGRSTKEQNDDKRSRVVDHNQNGPRKKMKLYSN